MVRGVRLAALLVLGGLTAAALGDPARPAREQGPLVELAWLESPITFPCPLAARVTGATLEVHGSVPNGTIREFVLAIARRHTTLPVIDRLTIDPGVTGWLECPADPKALAERATVALKKGLGKLANHYRVKTTMRGDVVLEGQTRSLEEKVRVSKCLRGLAGCRRVRNRLVVAASPVHPRAASLVGNGRKVKPPRPFPVPVRREARPVSRAKPMEFARSRPAPTPRPAPLALIGAESRPKKTPTKPRAVIKLRSPARAKKKIARTPRVRIEAPRKSVPPPPRRTADLLRLRQHVAGVCGPWARDVQVRQDNRGRIHVVVYVYNEGTLGTLRGWISELPDIRHPDVSLEMKLAR
jgi:hypothetical protein